MYPKRPVPDDIRHILVHQQHNQTGVVNKPININISQLRHRYRKYLTHDTAAHSRRTCRLDQTLPRLVWHGVELRLKLSCTRNGPVLDEARRICVRLQHQAGVVNNVFTTPMSQIRYLRHISMFAARNPDRLDAVTASLAWCRASIEAIVYPKLSSTRRDIYVVSACTHSMLTSSHGLRQHPVCGSLMQVSVRIPRCIIPQRLNYGREERAPKLWCTCSAVST